MRMFWAAALTVAVGAQDFRFGKQARVRREELRGAALVSAAEIWTWGDRLVQWRLDGLKARTLGRFRTAEGGCVFDVDRDGRLDLIAPTAEGLAWFRAPRWERTVIDAGALTADCVGAELLGHRGVIAVHRGMQIRFYEPDGAKWRYRELYSFYTPSHQAGLRLRDADGDGRVDLFCGNYWLQSPESFELGWRLFAINLWSERPESASASLAFRDRALIWAAGREKPGRVGVFTPALDPRSLWNAVEYGLEPPLAYPRAMGVWNDRWVLLAENNGAGSRTVAFREDGGARVLARGPGSHTLLVDRLGFVTVGASHVTRWVIPPLAR